MKKPSWNYAVVFLCIMFYFWYKDYKYYTEPQHWPFSNMTIDPPAFRIQDFIGSSLGHALWAIAIAALIYMINPNTYKK